MATKIISEQGRAYWEGVTDSTCITDTHFEPVESPCPEDNQQVAFHSDLGSLTVLRRMTGFGWWDTETGFRDTHGNFWLASGNMDVRSIAPVSFATMVDWVKANADTCVPTKEELSNGI